MSHENPETGGSEGLSGDTLTRLLMGCLLFRLGGEQTFTPEEIDEIKTHVAGVAVMVTQDNKILVRCKGWEATNKAYEDGAII